jgi:hypothetical protein
MTLEVQENNTSARKLYRSVSFKGSFLNHISYHSNPGPLESLNPSYGDDPLWKCRSYCMQVQTPFRWYLSFHCQTIVGVYDFLKHLGVVRRIGEVLI